MLTVFDRALVSAVGAVLAAVGVWVAYRIAATGDGGPDGEHGESTPPDLLVVLGYGDSTAALNAYAAVFAVLCLYVGGTILAWATGALRVGYAFEAMGVGLLSLSVYFILLGLLAKDPEERLSVRRVPDGETPFAGHGLYRRWVYTVCGLAGVALSGILILLTRGVVSL